MRIKEVKGWGQLPRELARALAGAKINGSESRVLWAMVYKTIAFNKSNDGIPWFQLEELTGIDQWHLGRSINSLLKKGIIFRKGNIFGVQLDFSKWETPPKQVVKDKTPPDQGELPPDQGELPPKRVDSRDLSKRTNQDRENFYKKLSGKEINKLEGDPWYKATMYNQGGFSIFYIQGTIDDFPFNTRMSCWYSYQEAKNVRDKEAYFSKLLRDYPGEE